MLRRLARSAAHTQPAGAGSPLSALPPRCTGCASHQQASSLAASSTEQCHGELRAPEAALPQQSADSLRQTPNSSAGNIGGNSSEILQESRSPALRHVADSLRPPFSPSVGSQSSPLQRQGIPPPSARSVAQASLSHAYASGHGEQARQPSASLSDQCWHSEAGGLPSPAAIRQLQSGGLFSRLRITTMLCSMFRCTGRGAWAIQDCSWSKSCATSTGR